MTVLAERPAAVQADHAEPRPVDYIFPLEVARIELDPRNPRPAEEVEIKAAELAPSIRLAGLREEIIVVPLGDGRWRVFEGNCRLRAHQLLGQRRINARIRVGRGGERARTMDLLATHAARNAFDPITEAHMMHDLLFVHDPKLTRDQVAELTGYSATTVANRQQLLNLTGPEQEMVRAGLLPLGDALALIRERAGRTGQPRTRRGVVTAAAIRTGAATPARQAEPLPPPATGPHANLYAMHTTTGGWQTTHSRMQFDQWLQLAAEDAALDAAAGIVRTFFHGQITWVPQRRG